MASSGAGGLGAPSVGGAAGQGKRGAPEWWWRAWVDPEWFAALEGGAATYAIDPVNEAARQLRLLQRLAAYMLKDVDNMKGRRANKIRFRLEAVAQFEREWLALAGEHGRQVRAEEMAHAERRKTAGKRVVAMAPADFVEAMRGERTRLATMAAVVVKEHSPKKSNQAMRFVNRAITTMHNQARTLCVVNIAHDNASESAPESKADENVSMGA